MKHFPYKVAPTERKVTLKVVSAILLPGYLDLSI